MKCADSTNRHAARPDDARSTERAATMRRIASSWASLGDVELALKWYKRADDCDPDVRR